jgi:hypothetical protein
VLGNEFGQPALHSSPARLSHDVADDQNFHVPPMMNS